MLDRSIQWNMNTAVKLFIIAATSLMANIVEVILFCCVEFQFLSSLLTILMRIFEAKKHF